MSGPLQNPAFGALSRDATADGSADGVDEFGSLNQANVPVRVLAGRSALYALAGAMNKLLALITVPILTRALTPEGYGLADLASGLAALLTTVALFGADIPAARLAAKDQPNRRAIHTTYVVLVLLLAIVLAAAVWASATLISSEVWNAPGETELAIWASVLIVATTARGAIITVQRLAGKARLFAIVSVIELTAELVLSVVFVLAGRGALGLIQGYVIGNLIGLALALALSRDLFAPSVRVATIRPLLIEGAAFLPAGVAFVIADYALRFLVSDLHGIEEVGQLATGARIASVMGLASAGFSLAWGPYAVTRPGTQATGKQFGTVLLTYGIGAMAIAQVIALFGPEIIGIVAGSAFVPGGMALPGLIGAAALVGTTHVALVATAVRGRTHFVAIAAIGGAVVQVVAAVILTPRLGLSGVGMSALIGQATALIIAVAAAGTQIILDRRILAGLMVTSLVVAAATAMAAHPDTLPLRAACAGCIVALGTFAAVRLGRSVQID